jgi:hypothetical protein
MLLVTSSADSSKPQGKLPWWAHVADALAAFYLFIAVYITVFGGVVFYVAGVRVQAREPIKHATTALVILLIRHWFRRTPSFWTRAIGLWRWIAHGTAEARDWILARLPVGVRTALVIAFATRLAIILLGGAAVETMGYPPDRPNWRASFDEFKNLPAKWDSGWYLQIARDGYNWDPDVHAQQSLVFFPAYPLVTRAAAFLIWRQDLTAARYLWAGVFVSILAFAGALVYLFALARAKLGEDNAIFALTLLATYPFAVFYSAAYTESLFLLAAVATFYHFTRGQLWRAVAWGLLAGLVRPNGWVVGATLGLIALPYLGGLFAWIARWLPVMSRLPVSDTLRSRRFVAIMLAVLAPVFGLLIYCGYVYELTGNPLTWAHLLTYWGRDFHGMNMLEDGLNGIAAHGIWRFVQEQPIDALNWFGLLFGVVSIWPVTRRLGLAYGLFVLMNILMPAASGGLVSIGRYSSTLFPSFLWLGMAAPKPVRPALVALFALGQAVAAIWFFTWHDMY